MTDTLNIAALEELEKTATPGPWENEGPRNNVIIWHGAGDNRVCFMTSDGAPIENAELICALRNAAPQLIAQAREADALRARVEELESRPEAPPRGCICPPTAELTCRGLSCPRASFRMPGA
jgi:hypothetical protein